MLIVLYDVMGGDTGQIFGEPPNNLLSKYEGQLHWGGQVYSLDNEKVLLRGCVLRNTKWCYGLVIFAGKETKLMMNSGKAMFKRTHIDRLMNILIIGVSHTATQAYTLKHVGGYFYIGPVTQWSGSANLWTLSCT